MGFCRSAVCVMILLLYLHCAVCEAAPPHSNVTVNLNDPATLPCAGHPGKVPWKVTWVKNPDCVVALCNQTLCWSEQGFEISYDKYLNGNYSLNITAVDHNDTGSYVCRSEYHILSNVQLQISVPSKKVNLHDTAVLPCFENCSGVARWFQFHKPSEVLAECNQTECRSVKDGYQMIYNQYLQGNLSLIITDVDFSKRGRYTCECDGMDLNDTNLVVNTVNSTLKIKPGDTLVLELEISQSVKVYYNGTVLYSVGQVCPVDGLSPRNRPENMHRLLRPAVELMNISQSDGGVYTVRDTNTNEDIHVYTVTVTDDQPSPSEDHSHDVNLFVFIGSLVGVSGIFLLVGIFIGKKKKPCEASPCIQMNPVHSNEDGSQITEAEAILPPEQQ